jgi:peptidoglycan/xylan/chitin deacetylase (PgdA/CDA1 family)
VILTSDDGWEDTYTNLAPIAREYKIPFFFGIIANKIDTTGFLSTIQIQDLMNTPLFTASSHSLNHLDHSKLGATQEQKEICDSKKQIESITGKPVDTFIFPS